MADKTDKTAKSQAELSAELRGMVNELVGSAVERDAVRKAAHRFILAVGRSKHSDTAIESALAAELADAKAADAILRFMAENPSVKGDKMPLGTQDIHAFVLPFSARIATKSELDKATNETLSLYADKRTGLA